MSDTPLAGQVALVTGGGGGIGRSAALSFARHGARVMVVDLKLDGGNETVEMISAEGGEASFLDVDVADEAAVEAMVAATVATMGGLDHAFNNAGISDKGVPFHEMELTSWDRMIRVNLTAVFLCMKHEIRHMLASGGGNIVNTASGAALIPAPGQCHYSAAKRGVVALTSHAAADYKRKGIRANCVLPGMIDTPMVRAGMMEDVGLEAIQQYLPTGRLGEPQEVGDVAVWLCTPAAGFVNGQAIVVDGGGLIA